MQSDRERQRKLNAGTRKNVEQKKLKHIHFKRHKPDHIHAGSSTVASVSSTEGCPKLFKDHSEFNPFFHFGSSLLFVNTISSVNFNLGIL